jgi:glycosyltransferase involved in cell wall biosynthesis
VTARGAAKQGDGRRTLGVVVVGQTPPPYHGQAVMIETLLEGTYRDATLYHVRMAFSDDLRQVGQVSAGKVLHLLGLVVRIAATRLRTGATVLYYPPAGAHMVPVLRDLVVLIATRWMFRATVFHFHAPGVSELEPRLPAWLRPLYRFAYRRAAVGIRITSIGPPDPAALGATHEVVLANCVADLSMGVVRRPLQPPVILYVGVLSDSRGLVTLLDACALIAARDRDLRLQLVGTPESETFAALIKSRAATPGLRGKVLLSGVLTGAAKADAYAGATVFCFPSQIASESFGLVLVEAMTFALPVVATRCGGIPSVVEDGETGLLVPVRDPEALAVSLEAVLTNAALAARLGANGRRRYEERFTVAAFRDGVQQIFELLRQPASERLP